MEQQEFNVVDHLIHVLGWGSQEILAEDAECAQSAVSSWKRQNCVPSKRIPKIIENGRKRRINAGPEDFFHPELKKSVETQDRAKA